MSTRDPKLANAKFMNYGDMTDIFVDDLATIEEFGTVTHIVFAQYRRTGGEVSREAIVRLIIPTELRAAMGPLHGRRGNHRHVGGRGKHAAALSSRDVSG